MAIEWTEKTWNPVTGCTKVSTGCRGCYAERLFPRVYGRQELPTGEWAGDAPKMRPRRFVDVVLHTERLTDPTKWRKPCRVFVNSMSDLFHPDVPDWFISEVFAAMALTPWHTFQILTKRPARAREYLANCGPLPNVWLGVSVEDQATADERIPLLLDTPAAVRFLSCEPLVGPIQLTAVANIVGLAESQRNIDALRGYAWDCRGPDYVDTCNLGARIDWVIAGGESGPGARPMHPGWPRALRDQCAEAGVPFFFKQWGEWRPPAPGEEYDTSKGEAGRPPAYLVAYWDGSVHCFYPNPITGEDDSRFCHMPMIRVGKRRAGRELDGATWDQYPEGVA